MTATREIPTVINAAGKLTSLGGSAQSATVASAQEEAAGQHVDLKKLRKMAGDYIASLTGAEAACVTTGAAAGISISIAALITGNNLTKVQQLPHTEKEHAIILQAGHAVNFGANVEQMIMLGGGQPEIIGTWESVPEQLLIESLDRVASPSAFLYVQSHHCAQENMIELPRCIELCKQFNVPVVVDAAAEEDLTCYVSAGVDLVTYSGGKAFCGPTVGFITGRRDLIESCELQSLGIARTMKVGKEQILGLLQALDEYQLTDVDKRNELLEECNDELIKALNKIGIFAASLKADEAGRGFNRVAVTPKNMKFKLTDLVKFLAAGDPSIHTRNHHLKHGLILIDPRELKKGDVQAIVNRFRQFAQQL